MQTMTPHANTDRPYSLPPLGDNPSTDRQGTTPGSFAVRGRVGTPWTFSSPDTPGMPGVSDFTAMNFADSQRSRGQDAARAGAQRRRLRRDEARRPARAAPHARADPHR